ncbi:MAG: CvpA family protein [Thiohalocapsa sp.]|jgi:membrane protein required for colicin V production|uniref:CvpA family protein n=1 Tax=Thiohalocapsa sp. TaxID=2497641 RepID=UPI0025ED0CFD|nr:CvpA family protein [Thiohalocapsa sp.]MCG6941116.1 CvpA family protein [Thiohalocapsa sp.]
MIWVDFIIIGIIVLSAIIGLARGLVREVLALGVWIAALLAAWFFYRPLADQLTPWLSTPSLRMGAAVVMIVVGVLIVGAIIGWVLSVLVDKTGLTGTDRLLGMVFGAGRGAVVVALLVFLASLTPVVQDAWWSESTLLPKFQLLADAMLDLIPPEVTQKIKSI